MEALVYHGPGRKAWGDVDDPSIIDAADAIVRVDPVASQCELDQVLEAYEVFSQADETGALNSC